jgi:hypothetical protein
MTEFTIENSYEESDGTETIVIDKYISTFEGGVFSVSSVVDSDESVLMQVQPWNPKGDGSREPWSNEEEAIEWFKSIN